MHHHHIQTNEIMRGKRVLGLAELILDTEIYNINISEPQIENKQRIHQRLYEQRELLKLKERQLHHKKIKKKMSLIPDND